MSEQQDIVTPSESASLVSSTKKIRPGKAQRAAKRASAPSQASATTGASSATTASMFARKMSFTPTPQPGKYPVVFPSGAGEPTRDSHFAIDGQSIFNCFAGVGQNYLNSARYAEFSSHAEYGDVDFQKDVIISGLLSIAQQIVHAHQNLGLPMGDFSSISSTDMFTMSAVRSIVRQFGEFSVESLGTRFLLHSYEDEVTALVRTAKRLKAQPTMSAVSTVLKEHWLPVRAGDPRVTFIVATKLKAYLERFHVSITMDELLSHLFQSTSTAFDAVKTVLPESDRDKFDVLFSGYHTKSEFVAKFSGNANGWVLHALDLVWISPVVASLDWDVVPKVTFPSLADPWLKKRSTLIKFFSCGSGAIEKSSAAGSPAQLGVLEATSGVTIVKLMVAVSAPEFSLFACFPPSAVYPFGSDLNVVLTTSIPVKVRATEFMQMDWL